MFPGRLNGNFLHGAVFFDGIQIQETNTLCEYRIVLIVDNQYFKFGSRKVLQRRYIPSIGNDINFSENN